MAELSIDGQMVRSCLMSPVASSYLIQTHIELHHSWLSTSTLPWPCHDDLSGHWPEVRLIKSFHHFGWEKDWQLILFLVDLHSIVLKLVKNSVPRVSTGKSRRNDNWKLVPSPATIVSDLEGQKQLLLVRALVFICSCMFKKILILLNTVNFWLLVKHNTFSVSLIMIWCKWL